ncbi:hypothetical protein PG996_001155 [Apiospora saccharicola]|uniref:Amidase domain-containing protein n=1 Tax=Apiospora saccharicola TaxID=335842 RepID=A0ABR1WFT3_9PEZI
MPLFGMFVDDFPNIANIAEDEKQSLNVHFPEANNPLNAWAWRCECAHANPSSSALKGKTVCLKDNIALAWVPCRLGTESFQDWTPQTDATVATRVLEAGGQIAGKAVCENLSRGAPSTTPTPGATRRAAAARARRRSVDFVGPMTRTCLECATLLEVLAGADGLDDRQGAGCPFPGQVPRYAEELKTSGVDGVKGLRIGILKEGLEVVATNESVKTKFLAAAKVFTDKLGAAAVEEVSVPMHASSRAIYSVLSKMGNHMGMLGRATGRRQVMLTDLAERKGLPYTPAALGKMSAFSHEGLLAGELGWSKYPLVYGKAVNLFRRLRDEYDATLKRYDVLILPTTLRASFPFPPVDAGPVAHMDAGRGMTENTASFNGTGHPALAVPIGFVPSEADPGIMVPASMQIGGSFWDEMTVLKVAYAWEQAVDWKSF